MAAPEDMNESVAGWLAPFRDRGDRPPGTAAEGGAAAGVVLGIFVFVVTEDPVWIALGIPIGAALGAAVDVLTRRAGPSR